MSWYKTFLCIIVVLDNSTGVQFASVAGVEKIYMAKCFDPSQIWFWCLQSQPEPEGTVMTNLETIPMSSLLLLW